MSKPDDEMITRVIKTTSRNKKHIKRLIAQTHKGVTTVVDPETLKPIAQFKATELMEIIKLVRRCATQLRLQRALKLAGVEVAPGAEETIMAQFASDSDDEAEAVKSMNPPARQKPQPQESKIVIPTRKSSKRKR